MRQIISFKVGQKIRMLRKSQHLNQQDIGNIIGVDQSQVSKIERGIQSVSSCQICQLSVFFRIHPSYFFDWYK